MLESQRSIRSEYTNELERSRVSIKKKKTIKKKKKRIKLTSSSNVVQETIEPPEAPTLAEIEAAPAEPLQSVPPQIFGSDTPFKLIREELKMDPENLDEECL